LGLPSNPQAESIVEVVKPLIIASEGHARKAKKYRDKTKRNCVIRISETGSVKTSFKQ